MMEQGGIKQYIKRIIHFSYSSCLEKICVFDYAKESPKLEYTNAIIFSVLM